MEADSAMGVREETQHSSSESYRYSDDDFENHVESEIDAVASLRTMQQNPRGALSWANTKEALEAGISEDMIMDFTRVLCLDKTQANTWQVTTKAFEILLDMRQDKTGPYTVDDFHRDTRAVCKQLQSETPVKYQLNPYTNSAMHYLEQLKDLEDATERAEQLAKAERLRRNIIWGRAQVFLAIVPAMVLFCGVVMGTVCQQLVHKRSLAVAGACVIDRIVYRNYSEPCACGTCKGRTSRTCYTTYPCLVVDVTYTDPGRQMVVAGHLSGSNRSTQCAKDILAPCHMEAFANNYAVGEFERGLSPNFTCYRHEHYPEQFILPEDLRVPGSNEIFNCFFWPVSLLVFCCLWFVVAVLQLIWERACPAWRMPSVTCNWRTPFKSKSRLRQPGPSSVKIPVVISGKDLFLEMPVERQFDNQISLQEYTTKVRRESLRAQSNNRFDTVIAHSTFELLEEASSSDEPVEDREQEHKEAEDTPEGRQESQVSACDYDESNEQVLTVVDL